MRAWMVQSALLRIFLINILSITYFTGSASPGSDTTQIKQLLDSARQQQWDNKEAAAKNLKKAESIALRSKHKKSLVHVWLGKAMFYQSFNQHDSCTIFINKVLKLAEKINYIKGIASAHNIIGNTHYSKGNYQIAIEHFFKSLKISVRIKDSMLIAGVYNNIGNVYDALHQNEKAINYYEKAAQLNIKLENKSWLGINYNNLGILNQRIQQNKKAIYYLNKSIVLQKETNNDWGYALAISNKGNAYRDLKYPDSALACYKIGLALYQRMQITEGIARCKVNMASIYDDQNESDSAYTLALQALNEAKSIEEINVMESAYRTLATILYKQKNYKVAFDYQLEYINTREKRIDKDKIAEATQRESEFKFYQKQERDSIARKEIAFKQNLLQKQKDEKQRVYTLVLFVIITILALFGFNAYRNFRKKNTLTKELTIQKQVIELKNTEITESIMYARHIQNSLLPDSAPLKNYFAQSFILYKPKDIVSGDFYWMKEENNCLYFAVADCTGHGVPGAMMAVMMTNFLNEIIVANNGIEPHTMLSLLDQKLTSALHSKSNHASNDGMDGIILRYHKEKKEITVSLAKRPLFYAYNNKLMSIKADKHSVGGHENEEKHFTSHTLPAEPGKKIYLFTDGYSDQYGGIRHKKFKLSNVKKLIEKNIGESSQKQFEVISHTFNQWQGAHEQTDDVCFVVLEI